MRRYLAITIAAVLVATPLYGQSRERQSHPAARVPSQPRSRGAGAAPEWEPGRENGAVPYVRGDHWYGHAAPNDPRFHLDRPFEHGRFALAGANHRYTVVRFDLAAHRLWLRGGYGFEIAAWDWPYTAPWCWDCDQFVVYVDPDHPGWYILYDVRFGEYVHVQYLGV
jgi:hypothetical protein